LVEDDDDDDDDDDEDNGRDVDDEPAPLASAAPSAAFSGAAVATVGDVSAFITGYVSSTKRKTLR
jgi:hypothetical protein